MFIAHAPAGYILGTAVAERVKNLPISTRLAILACLIGSLAPDLDMLYFYLIDHRQTHHHKYITHWPLLWTAIVLASVLWRMLSHNSKAAVVVGLFSICGLLHLLMDTVVGDIWWLAPFVDRPFAFFEVQARLKPWWLNFILHWSFAFELFILGWAMLRYRRRSQLVVRQ